MTNTFSVAVRFVGSQANTFSCGSGVVFNLESALTSTTAFDVTLSGQGTWRLFGDNGNLTRPFRLSAARVEVYHRRALGGTGRETVYIWGTFKIYCLTNDTPMYFSNRVPSDQRFNGLGTGTLVLNGKWRAQTGDPISAEPKEFRGGLARESGMWMINTAENADVWVYDTWHSNGGVGDTICGNGTVHIACTNDISCSMMILDKSTSYSPVLRCECAGTLRADRPVCFGEPRSPRGTLDLNGFNQSVNSTMQNIRLISGDKWFVKGSAGFGEVTSATPATLRYRNIPWLWTGAGGWENTANVTNQVRFTGHVSLDVDSANDYRTAFCTHTFLNVRSTTDGSLTVRNGGVAFDWGAGWSGGTNVLITGAHSRIRVAEESAPYAFGSAQYRSKAYLTILDGGKLQLDGGQATVYALSTNGVTFLDSGIYGSGVSGVPAANQLPCLEGPGTLYVRTNARRRGFAIIFR